MPGLLATDGRREQWRPVWGLFALALDTAGATSPTPPAPRRPQQEIRGVQAPSRPRHSPDLYLPAGHPFLFECDRDFARRIRARMAIAVDHDAGAVAALQMHRVRAVFD